MNDFQDARAEAYLDALTEALLAGRRVNVAALAHTHDMPYPDAEALYQLVGGLNSTLVAVAPSDAFHARMRADLLGERYGVFGRIRNLPGRVQWAATLAVVAGAALLGRRRFRTALGQLRALREDEAAEVPLVLRR